MVQNLYSERELSMKLLLGEKNSKKKLTFDHFGPTHTHTKLTLNLSLRKVHQGKLEKNRQIRKFCRQIGNFFGQIKKVH